MSDQEDEWEPPTVVPLVRFMRNARPIFWTLDGIIEMSTLMMLFGEPGAGKTFLALDWALCIATGRPWKGRAVLQGSVVYIATEGIDGLRRRVRAWCAHHGVDEASVPLHVCEAPALTEERTVGSLAGIIDELEPRVLLIVIDTLTGATPGMDQNASRDMAAFARTCGELRGYRGAAVLIVHHSGHKSKDRAKGAIDLLAACDREAGVSRVLRREDVVRVTCTKSRNGPPFPDIHLKLQDCDPAAVLVEAPETEGADARAMSRADRLFREALGEEPEPETDVRARFDAAYKGTAGARRNAWARALKKATDAGAIEYDSARGLISLCART